MSDEPGLEQLRGQIVDEHGLDPAAASFITGGTVEEIERQVGELAQLVTTHGAEAEAPAPLDLFGAVAGAKAERQRALIGALHSPPPQERDERGRFTGPAGFDGGARERERTPAPVDGVADHASLIGGMIGRSVARRGFDF